MYKLVLILLALNLAMDAAPADDNRGVLNGPLMQGGHRAQGEGNCTSLKLAIEDLMATHGDKYP